MFERAQLAASAMGTPNSFRITASRKYRLMRRYEACFRFDYLSVIYNFIGVCFRKLFIDVRMQGFTA